MMYDDNTCREHNNSDICDSHSTCMYVHAHVLILRAVCVHYACMHACVSKLAISSTR